MDFLSNFTMKHFFAHFNQTFFAFFLNVILEELEEH